MNVSSDVEQDLRAYLSWLQDPSSLRDDSRVAELEKDFAASDDPIARLKLAAEIANAENPPVDQLRDRFVAEAKNWAEAENIPLEAFTRMGVPADDLRRAGFKVAGSRRQDRPRRGRVTVGDLAESLPRRPFTMRDLHEASGASMMTVRRAVQQLLADGAIAEVGADPDYDKPGKAPQLYERSAG